MTTGQLTNLDRVRAAIRQFGNTPFTVESLMERTGLSKDQVKRALRDTNVNGMGKRADGRYQVRGRTVR